MSNEQLPILYSNFNMKWVITFWTDSILHDSLHVLYK